MDAQLGRGTAGAMFSPSPAPVLIGEVPLTGIQSIVAGSHHTCALRNDGAVFCWGRHDRGQLGVPAPPMFAQCQNACIPTAVAVVGFEGATPPFEEDGGIEEPFDASVGDGALADSSIADSDARDGLAPNDAGVDGQLIADVSVINDIVFQDTIRDSAVTARPTVTSIAAGRSFSCVSLSDETVRCWGSNRQRELGSGTTDEGGSDLSVVIAGPGAAPSNPLHSVRRVSAGGATVCATLSDRSLRCWGSNEYGALGIGTLAEQRGPLPVTW